MPSLSARLLSRDVWLRAMLVTFLALLTTFAHDRSARRFTWQLGDTSTQAILSRVAFNYTDKRELSARQQQAMDLVPSYFQANPSRKQMLDTDLLRLGELTDIKDAPPHWELSEEALRAVRQLSGTPRWKTTTRSFVRRIFDLATLSPSAYEFQRTQRNATGLFLHPDPLNSQQAGLVRRNDSILLSSSPELRLQYETAAEDISIPKSLRNTFVNIAMGKLDEEMQPAYHPDQALTDQEREAARARETPKEIPFERGQPIVTIDSDKIKADITIDALERLKAEHRAWKDAEDSSGMRWARLTGVFLLTIALYTFLFGYLNSIGSRMARNGWRATALSGLLSLSLVCSLALSGLMPSFPTAPYAFPVLAVAMVMVVAYDRRQAIAVAGLLAGITMLAMHLSAATGLSLLAGVAGATIPLRDLRRRSDLVLSGLWGGVALTLGSLAAAAMSGHIQVNMVLSHPSTLTGVLHNSAATLGMALATGMIIQGVLPLIERAFNITTSLTLKELNDASHPMLQLLVRNAPGTYQHSLRIADIAESAAETIGANGLLCRVGAMYHDVGKALHPHFFIENIGNSPNPHNKLAPEKSAEILACHVTDGLELAWKHHLPTPILQCIASHHGTTRMEFFYHSALKRYEEGKGPKPDESTFRYPGPLPSTPEAAILMLCDGIESASRTLPEHSREAISTLVDSMCSARLQDGQLAQCPMSFKDLATIKASFVRSLAAMYHERIRYPSDSGSSNTAK